MTTHYKITCNQCGHDLTYTGNAVDYFLTLSPATKGHTSDTVAVTMVAMQPDIRGDHHFCGIGCLSVWLTEKHPNARATYDRVQKHRKWLAEKMAEGSS